MLSYHSIFMYSLCIGLTNQTHKREKVEVICYHHRVSGEPGGAHMRKTSQVLCLQYRNLSTTSQATFIRQHLTLGSLVLSTVHIEQADMQSLAIRSRKVENLSQGHPAKGGAEPRCKLWFPSGSPGPRQCSLLLNSTILSWIIKTDADTWEGQGTPPPR